MRKGLKDLKYNKDKMLGLRENIQMYYLGMGRADAQTNWSENHKQKTIPQLTDRLIEIIKMFKNVPVPDDPNTTMPQRKQQPVVGTLTHKVRQLNREREKKLEGFNMGSWKVRWFPEVRASLTMSGYYQLPPEHVMVPFHSFAAHNGMFLSI